jgi:hypothetical protein
VFILGVGELAHHDATLIMSAKCLGDIFPLCVLNVRSWAELAHEISSKLHVTWSRGLTRCPVRFKNNTAYFPAVSFPLHLSLAIIPQILLISWSRTKIGKHATIFIVSEIQQQSRINIRKRHSKRLFIYRSCFGNHLHRRNIQNDTMLSPSRYHVRRRGSRTTEPGTAVPS